MTIDQTLSAAVDAMSRGALGEAEAHCRSVLEAHPDHFFAMLILADVLTHAGRTSEAFSLYQTAAEISPGHSLAFSRITMLKFRRAFGAPPSPRETPQGMARIQMTRLGAQGRFGNQLLQYAVVRLYAKRNGLSAEFPDWIGRDLFDLDDPFPSARLAMVDERNADIFSSMDGRNPQALSEIDVSGYFCGDMREMSPHKEAIRAFFTPGRKVAGLLGRAVERLRSAGNTVVAIHLRRSDFGYSRFWVAPASWYAAWLRTVLPTFEVPVLYVASEDPRAAAELAEFTPWDARRLGIDIPGAEFLIDHHILREADHVAIANSTFSYTAAMLNVRAKSFMRPDPDTRRLVEFDPWASVVMRDPAVPPPGASGIERQVLEWCFSDRDSVLHLGEHCAPWTNLARSIRNGMVVHEAEPETSLDRWRTENKMRHLRHLVVQDAARLADVLERACETLAHSRLDMLHFQIDERGTIPSASAAALLDRHGYVLCRILGDEVELLTPSAEYKPGRYMAVQQRLLPRMFQQHQAQSLDLPKLCRKYRITVRGVIHVGAHEGKEISAYDAAKANRVLFIEANPAVHARLVQAMRSRKDVIAVSRAISDSAGRVQLHLASFDMSSSLLPMAKHRDVYPDIVPAGTIEVEATTLDALIGELGLAYRDFNLLVIDVQGAEALVLNGARETLAHIAAVQVEVNFTDLYRGGSEIEQVDDILSSYGFKRVATLSAFDVSWGDAFYVRHLA